MPMHAAWHASVIYARTLRCWCLSVATTVIIASTNRDPWALCVPKLPLRHRTPGRIARLQSMEGSLPSPLLQNRACHFCGTRLLSDVPSVIGIRPTVNDNRADLWSDVSRLSLVGHRSLTPQHGSSASPALLLPITCPSPSSRQHIRGIALGLGFLRNPSPSALRLAPAPVLHRSRRARTGLLRS